MPTPPLRLLPAALLALTAAAPAQLPPPPVPAGNPVTAEKVVLGKVLFWDEQLSSDNTRACGSCHLFELGGSDVRAALHPGLDGTIATGDDVHGSFGVVRSDANNGFARDPLFDLNRQVTPRWAPTVIGAAYFDEVFWDGRAQEVFTDPVSGAVVLPSGGALESQAVSPPLSDVEMAHEARDWPEVTAKLAAVRPLAMATDLTPDVVAALAADPTYPQLFDAAFGDPAITAQRIALALATYQRTLVPDQTPWDLHVAGDPSALTADQEAGLALFEGQARCVLCHVPPLFSDGLFHNVGLRPPMTDIGLQAVTGDPDDLGKFKTATLRNAGLRRAFHHTGQTSDLGQVVAFYDGGGLDPTNQDPLIQPLGLLPGQAAQLRDFVENGLTDPRVRDELPPFDRPTLHHEVQAHDPILYGQSSVGAGGFAPRMLGSPAVVANPDYRVGLADALGGTLTLLVASLQPVVPAVVVNGIPVNVDFGAAVLQRLFVTPGAGPGDALLTVATAFPDDPAFVGLSFAMQWFVSDVAAAGELAASRGAAFTAL